ncbi:MAG TPA: tellurite resistance TerB family protein [Archangium sp.]|nr:tellurite resistance TerB family protein [Archangium sp.]
MGLLSMFRSDKPAKKASDDVLLLHTMLLMAGADGYLDQAEVETVEAYFTQLPEFEGKTFQDIYGEAKKLVSRYSNLRESVKALSGLSSERVRKKAFVLAADLAMASGDVDENEDELLTAMQRVLEIDDGTAQKVLEVLSMKYAR